MASWVVGALLLVAIVATLVAAVGLVRRVLSWAAASTARSSAPASSSEADRPPAYGSLPTLADPVGPLGNPAPDADLGPGPGSSRDIYGE
jgi:hypothetical protein